MRLNVGSEVQQVQPLFVTNTILSEVPEDGHNPGDGHNPEDGHNPGDGRFSENLQIWYQRFCFESVRRQCCYHWGSVDTVDIAQHPYHEYLLTTS